MANREKIAIGEYYHIYNRGVDKSIIVKDKEDADRFIQSLECFNSIEPILSLREYVSCKKEKNIKPKNHLVEIVSYCLNPNHFHMLLKEKREGGISEFMKRLGGGYTWYFNNKNRRHGSLFQGTFKSIRIKSNEQLLHTSVYVALNWRVHKISGSTAGNVKSSWDEYIGKSSSTICSKNVILEQFRSLDEYMDFAESSLKQILTSREDKAGLEMLIGKHFF